MFSWTKHFVRADVDKVHAIHINELQEAADDMDDRLNYHIGKGGTDRHPLTTDTVPGFFDCGFKKLLDILAPNVTPDGKVKESPLTLVIDDVVYKYDGTAPQTITIRTGPPVGSIIDYWGPLSNIPANWALCDGTNGTPALRNKFSAGAGGSYALGDTGGEDYHVLTEAELPSQSFQATVSIPLTGDNDNQGNLPVGGTFWGTEHGNFDANVTLTSNGKNEDHENRPPFVALYKIMRLR